MKGQNSSQIKTSESELREQGLRVLARIIARSHMQDNSAEYEFNSAAAQYRSSPPSARKREKRTFTYLEGTR